MFKRLFLFFIFFGFVLTLPILADNLIIPGERIGPYTLKMSTSDIISMLGYSNDVNKGEDGEMWSYSNIGFSISKEKVVYIVTPPSGYQWVTDKGISIGSSFARVKEIYGTDYDYAENKNTQTQDLYDGVAWYDFDGICFDIKNNQVVRIWIYEPWFW